MSKNSAIGISNHNAIYAILNTFTTKKIPKSYQIRNFNISDEEVQGFCNRIDWSIFGNCDDPNVMIDFLYDSILYPFLNGVCPAKTVISRNQPTPWMNGEIKKLMNHRDEMYKLYKSNIDNESGVAYKIEYRKFFNETKYAIRRAKLKTFSEKYEGTNNSKEKWDLVHKYGITKKSKKNGAFESLDHFIKNVANIDLLNEEFTRLQPLPFNDLKLNPLNVKFEFEMEEPEYIRQTIFHIKSNSTGPDNIPPKIFKLLSAYIAQPIATIINTSYRTGIFPSRLKNVVVTPIPKVDVPTTVSQIRPVSNANFLLKIFSTLSCSQLTDFCEINSIITENQSGFRRNHSCTTAMLKLTEDAHKTIANGKCMILVMLDFSNAYGMVDHNRLI